MSSSAMVLALTIDNREALFCWKKCCNTTILDPLQFRSVGVGLTFHSFVGATFTSFVGLTVFVSHQMTTVGVGGNYAPFVVALLLFLIVPTYFGSEKCWRYFFPFVGPTI